MNKPNRLHFDRNGRAAQFYRSLSSQERSLVDESLARLQASPVPDGELITQTFRPPVSIYYYNDGRWKIAYGLSYVPSDGIFHISVYSIGRAQQEDSR